MNRAEFKKIWITAAVIFIAGYGSVVTAWAQPVDTSFKSNTEYDIYFQGAGDGISVIKDAKIIGVYEINELKFLVIESGRFKVSNDYGYIRYDSILAILPQQTFRIQAPGSTNSINFQN